jgi:4-hydroxy-tetrahydrodipicolinate reductase
MITIGISGINGRVGRVLKTYLEEESGKDSDDNSDVKLVAGLSRQKLSPDASNSEFLMTSDYAEFLNAVDVVIDFSLPDHLVALAGHAAAYKTPLVSGTTGLTTAQMHEIEAAAKITPLLHAGNMSLGVNLLCALVKQSAARLGFDYDLEISETHHRLKRDAPSGTALMLGQAAAQGRGQDHDEVAVYGRNGTDAQRQEGEIGYAVQRGGSVIGAHEVSFYGPSEELTLSHKAHDRRLFASGALFAARWLHDKPAGHLYSMADALLI